jgi:hypothetical protein
MNSLDYVEAVARQHEAERERDRAARFRQLHPDENAGRDTRWAEFIHRWASHTGESEAAESRQTISESAQ